MFDTAANAYRKFVVCWVATACRTAWLVVAASLLLTAASVNYLAGNIRINTATTDMLSKELPFRQHAQALSAAFPQFTDNILVVIDAANPDIAEDAAIALAERLRRNPELFGSVYDLEGSEFFRRNGLLYLDVDKLYELSDRLAEAQPFLGTLWRDPSLRGFVHMLELAIDESLKSTGEAPIELTRVFVALAEVAEAQAAGGFGQLAWQRLMSGADSDAVADNWDGPLAHHHMIAFRSDNATQGGVVSPLGQITAGPTECGRGDRFALTTKTACPHGVGHALERDQTSASIADGDVDFDADLFRFHDRTRRDPVGFFQCKGHDTPPDFPKCSSVGSQAGQFYPIELTWYTFSSK